MPVTVSLGQQSPNAFTGSLLAIAVEEGTTVSGSLAELDTTLAGAIQRAVESRDFRSSRDEIFHLSGAEGSVRRVVLIGMGKITDRIGSIRRAAAIAARQGMKLGSGDIAFYAADLDERGTEAAVVGLIVGSWEYKDLKTPPPDEEKRQPLATATVLGAVGQDAGLAAGLAIGAGHSLARTLAMMPGNICTPEYLADTAVDIGARHGMKVTVLGRKEMEAEG